MITTPGAHVQPPDPEFPDSDPRVLRARSRKLRFGLYVKYLPFLVMMVLTMWLMVEGLFVYAPERYGPLAGVGPDFAMFYSAAHVLASGANPYDSTHLAIVDASITRHANLPAFPLAALVRVGNPPLFFWLMRPLASLPYRAALLIWIALLVIALAAGSLAALRAFRWTHPAVIVPVFLFPSVDNALRTANVVPFVFAGIGIALLLTRHFPLAAGAVLSLAWLKPQVGLPFAALIVLFQSPAPARVLAGFALATLGGTALTILTTGAASLAWWVHSFTGYSNSIAVQGDIASLTGIYYRWASPDLRLSLQVVTVAVAVAATGFWWWRNREGDVSPISVAWLWFLWFLATPYDLFDDQMLLTVPVLALLGRNGSRIRSPRSAIVLYALFLCIVPFNISLSQMQLLWLPTLIAAGAAGTAAVSGSRRKGTTQKRDLLASAGEN